MQKWNTHSGGCIRARVESVEFQGDLGSALVNVQRSAYGFGIGDTEDMSIRVYFSPTSSHVENKGVDPRKLTPEDRFALETVDAELARLAERYAGRSLQREGA